MKTKLTLMLIGVLFCGLTSYGQTRIEDTDAGTISYDGSLKSYSNADNGTAINLSNDADQQIVWNYSASSAGTADLTWRYTRKATMASTARIYVNGTQVQEISLPETVSGEFSTYSISASLNSGTNEIIMETVEDAEFADIDWIEISGDGGTTTTYNLTTSVVGSGSVSPSSGTYDAGTSVTLTATPSSGYQFDSWSGDASGTSTSVTIVMNSNMSVTANFSAVSSGSSEITIQENGTGFCSVDGSVDNNNAGFTGDGFANTDNASGNGIDYKVNVITAGTYTVTVRYAATSDRPADLIQNGSTVASLALPSTGSWTTWNTASTTASLSAGVSDLRLEATGSSGLPNIDYITLAGSNISAYDCEGGTTPTTYTLSTSVNGQGSVSPSSGTYDAGANVTLNASPSSGWQFDNWSGDASGTNSSVTIVMNSNMSVTANFSEISTGSSEITLQENATGFCSVDGAVESDHSGYTGSGYANTTNETGTGVDYKVNVATAGTYTFTVRYAATSDRPADIIQNGSTVGNIALPSSGAWTSYTTATTTAYLSAGESDLRLQATSSSGLPNIDYLYISGANISAADCGSSSTTYSLSTSVSPSGAGSVSLSPSGGTYEAGTQVTLSASASTDYSFSSWSGDASGSSSSITVTVNSNMSVTANFTYTGGSTGNADFSLLGYATQNGGTTGGSGGTTVTASTGDQIMDYIEAKKDGEYSSGLVIMVNGTVTTSNTSVEKIDVKECRDVSIIGAGSGAEFNGIGIKVYKAGNVILRNLKIHHVSIGDKDCISIEGPADHVWVDHCELYNEFQGADKDYYDGLLDAKAESEYITYSWNYLHDSWKTMLVGSSDGDDHDRKITGHHNIFENCNSRMPLYRFGTGHFFNNYYVDVASTGLNSRMGACLRVENNYFQNSLNPYVTAYSDDDGYGDLIGNILDNCTWDIDGDVNELPSCNSSVPYSYSSALNSASEVPNITRQYAGVGKLSDPASYSVKSAVEGQNSITAEDGIALQVYPNPFNGFTHINFTLNTEQAVSINIYDMTGRIVENLGQQVYGAGQHTVDFINQGLMPGIYILSIQNGANIQNTRLVVE